MKNTFKKSLLVLGTTIVMTVTVAAGVNYSLCINGKKVDAKIIVENGTTYVPLRLVGEMLNANVRVVNGVINVDSNVVVQEDMGTMIYNNKEYPLPKGIVDNNNNEEIKQLTQKEDQLIKDVKTVLNKDIVIENGIVYLLKDGEKVKYRDVPFWEEWVQDKVQGNAVLNDMINKTNQDAQ